MIDTMFFTLLRLVASDTLSFLLDIAPAADRLSGPDQRAPCAPGRLLAP